MPNFDGTGPQGQGAMTGRRRGRCQDTQTTQIEKSENRIAENKDAVYGLGRGGRPRGCGGVGNNHAGGYGKGQGRGRGRGFENK